MSENKNKCCQHRVSNTLDVCDGWHGSGERMADRVQFGFRENLLLEGGKHVAATGVLLVRIVTTARETLGALSPKTEIARIGVLA